MITLFILGIFLFSSLGLVSSETFIVGEVYDSESNSPIVGADIIVTCNGYNENAITDSYGTYDVEYNVSACGEGSVVSVVAEKDGYFGSDTGVVQQLKASIKFAVVNVAIIPEFKTIIGIGTLLACLSIFFIVRRE